MKEDISSLRTAFQEKLKKVHDGLEERRVKTKPIFHYTSFEGLQYILSSRHLWYTDYKYLNDPTELIYSKSLINQVFLNRLQRIDDREIRNNVIRVYQFLVRIFENFNSFYNIYICSFSLSEELALWRYYGDGGNGFAISFNENFQRITSTANFGDATICQVIYEDQEAIINQLIDVLIDFASIAGFFDRNITPLAESIFISYLLSLLPILKDNSFRDEQEVRLYVMEGKALIDPATERPFFYDSEVREFVPIRTKYDKPFVNSLYGKKPVVHPHSFEENQINEIIIGPCCEFIEARNAILHVLEDNNYGTVNIRKANLPFQN